MIVKATTVPDETEALGCDVRIVTIYSVPWQYDGPSSRDLREELELGKLREHYELYRDQLPRLLPDEFFGGKRAVESIHAATPTRFHKHEAMLFALPSNQVVLAIVIGFSVGQLDGDGVRAVTEVLERTIEGQVEVDGVGLATHVAALPVGEADASAWKPHEVGESPLLPERHQLVFITPRGNHAVPEDPTIDRIVYRKSPPYSEEFARLQKPGQLNLTTRGRVTLGVVTPYVSLLYNHQREVEDSIFLSTVHAVGTSSTFRQIWHESYRQVRQFRLEGQAQEAGVQTRGALEKLADNLGNLEFDLTFSVEFPLMRIETFHTALYEAMDLSGQARALSQMFSQLGGSLRSEITAIDVRERRQDEGRQRWNAFAAGVLSLVGVSVGFVIAFLGINTKEVPSDPVLSMWDSRFATVYLLAGLFALVPVFLILFPYLRDWANRQKTPRQRMRTVGAGVGALVLGAALIWGARFIDASTGRTLVVDAIMESIGVLGLLVGVSLVLLRVWQRLFHKPRSA